MKKKATKPLHLQKSKAPSASRAIADFGPKMSSDAWFADDFDDDSSDDESSSSSSWRSFKRGLISYHDSAKEISLETMVESWDAIRDGDRARGIDPRHAPARAYFHSATKTFVSPC